MHRLGDLRVLPDHGRLSAHRHDRSGDCSVPAKRLGVSTLWTGDADLGLRELTNGQARSA